MDKAALYLYQNGGKKLNLQGYFPCCLLTRKLLPPKEVIFSMFSRIATSCFFFIDNKNLKELNYLLIYVFNELG